MEERIYTEEEKRAIIERIEETEQKQIHHGKQLVCFIAITNVLLSIVSACLNTENILLAALQLILSILLVCGVPWLRYLFAAGALSSAFLTLYTICKVFAEVSFTGFSAAEYWFFAFAALYFCYCVFFCAALFVSKAVSAYFYNIKK